MFDKSIAKNAVMLGIFAIATIGLCVVTHGLTKDRIAEVKRKALESALVEIVPKTKFNNDILEDTLVIDDPRLGNKTPLAAYRARFDGNPVAVVFQVAAPEGYGGAINLLVGVYADGTLAGTRVVPPHPETPGLGDAIETKKSDWILEFTGKSLTNPKPAQWKVNKDGGVFDSFTGATITPRAVVKAVFQTLQYFDQNKVELFQPNSSVTTAAISTSNKEIAKDKEVATNG